MKLLIKPLFTLFFFLVVQTLFAQSNTPLYSISDEKVDIEFTVLYTFTDLVEIKEELAEKDMTLTYQSLQFDESGSLRRISATLETTTGYKAAFTSRELQPSDKPGFHLTIDKGNFVKAREK